MHELAVTESILNIALTHARKAEATKVTDIYIQIGRLSSIVDESVQFYWDMVSEGTMCAGSKLHFQRFPAELLCLECNNKFTVPKQITPCPKCGSLSLKVLSGDQFNLESIEIEK